MGTDPAPPVSSIVDEGAEIALDQARDEKRPGKDRTQDDTEDEQVEEDPTASGQTVEPRADSTGANHDDRGRGLEVQIRRSCAPWAKRHLTYVLRRSCGESQWCMGRACLHQYRAGEYR